MNLLANTPDKRNTTWYFEWCYCGNAIPQYTRNNWL